MSTSKQLNNFQQLVRALAKYIKAHHHLAHTNCSPSTRIPKRIQKIRSSLSTAIHPYNPTPITDLHTKYNATNWGVVTLQVLEDHYKLLLENAKDDITQLDLEEWERALTIATKWVKRDLTNIKQDTLKKATNNLKILIKNQLQKHTPGTSSDMETMGDDQHRIQPHTHLQNHMRVGPTLTMDNREQRHMHETW